MLPTAEWMLAMNLELTARSRSSTFAQVWPDCVEFLSKCVAAAPTWLVDDRSDLRSILQQWAKYEHQHTGTYNSPPDIRESDLVLRKVDRLGRVVIPFDMRRPLGVKKGHHLEIYLDGQCVVLLRHQPMCLFCSQDQCLQEFKGKQVCAECLDTIPRLSNRLKGRGSANAQPSHRGAVIRRPVAKA